jgi:multidrug efflux pump
MVLVIGLLVDDAIVVIENVERIMAEEGLGPREATLKSMREITGALVGIALVLSAVLLPMAFFGGSTGVIYRQFSITMVSAIVLSIFVALVLTPALCATLLKPASGDPHGRETGFFGWFNRNFNRARAWHEVHVTKWIAGPRWPMIGYGLIMAALAFLFVRLPTGFLPAEDQGAMFVQVTLPAGAVQSRTLAVMKTVQHELLVNEKDNVQTVFSVAGFGFGASGQNAGMNFIRLKDWDERRGARNHAPAIADRVTRALSSVRDARIFALVPPAVQELGNATGFDLELEDRGGLGHIEFAKARDRLVQLANESSLLANVRPAGQADTPQLHIDIDRERAGALGVPLADINATLASAWGPTYVDDFIDRGRVKRVYMQGDMQYRMSPEDLDFWQVRNSAGEMTPLSAFATTSWEYGPSRLERYNGHPAFEIQGQPAPGKSSGAAIAEMEKLIRRLPPGVGFEWTGLSYQEIASGAQAPALYALSILVVFLCLAALYESWSIPLAVLLVLPIGVVGAVLAATLRGLYNDIYFQVGLLTTMGLAAKNAILIVEFAVDAVKKGAPITEAAIGAAKLRLRPILMTSLAFVAGVFPLAVASSAGAGSQNDIGTGVVGGMVTATLLAVFYVPLFFVLVERYLVMRGRRQTGAAPQTETSS